MRSQKQRSGQHARLRRTKQQLRDLVEPRRFSRRVAILETDLHEALSLLRGYIGKNGRGLPKLEYLAPRSVRERYALAALARVLRTGSLSPDLCYALADLFDPDPDSFKSIIPEGSDRAQGYVATSVVQTDRKLVFQFRRQGKRKDALTRTAIMQHMSTQSRNDMRKRGSRERALESAVDTFAISRELAEEIWDGFQWAVDRGLFDEDD